MRSVTAADEEPKTQRAWQAETDLWARAKDTARQNRANPTRAEKILWEALRARRLYGGRFRRQHVIDRFLVDFYCSEARLVVEVDGEIHRFQAEEDRERQRALEERGLRVIRFTNAEVIEDLASVRRRIAAHLTPHPSPTSERGTQRSRSSTPRREAGV